jgi:hypothetical protein
MDVLDRIERLKSSMGKDARIEDADAWWTDFELIESDIERDPRSTKQERETVAHIKGTLSTFTMTLRAGGGSPDASTVRAHLLALQRQIRKRTIGPDGWPLE